MFVFNAVVICLCTALAATRPSEKILMAAVDVEFPFLVGLMTAGELADNVTVCTGTLVTSVFVLSSAYCTSRLRTGIEAYRRVSAYELEHRPAVNVYVHPMYDSAKRVNDLSLIKLERSFGDVGRFARLSSNTFGHDVELDCVVVGIGTPHGSSYKVPVRVRYGRTACHIPEYNAGLKYIIAYTWTEFLCANTVVGTSLYLPCDRGDALVCNGNRQYGVFSYGYGTSSDEADDCGDPTVQSRHVFVNKHTQWIDDTVSPQSSSDTVAKTTTTTSTPTTTTTKTKTTTTTKMITTKTTTTKTTIRSDDVEFPPANRSYLVYLEGGSPDEPVCGGTLISPVHVLTAAYCTTRMSEIHVYLSSDRRRHTNASLVYVHPDFDSNTLTADVSVVVLREPFDVAGYARLADAFGRSDVGASTKTAVVSDCALMAKTSYLYVPVKIKYGPAACRKALHSEVQKAVDRTWREFVCGVPRNRTGRDAGDPLICDGLQYGITSHSYRTTRAVDQVRFLYVKNYRRWIDDVAAGRPDDNSGDRTTRSRGALVVVVLLLLLPPLLRAASSVELLTRVLYAVRLSPCLYYIRV